MGRQKEWPVIAVGRPLSDTGGALTISREGLSKVYVGMTVMLIDQERQHRDGEITQIDAESIYIAYPSEPPPPEARRFWRHRRP